MDDLKDQSAVSTTATNGVVESEEVRAQEALLGDTDPSLTSADDVAKALNVDPSHGLSEEEAKRRLAKFGPNELASAPPVPKWKKFLAQFQDPLVYLLIAATIISVIAWFIEKANAQPGAEGGEVLPFDAIVIILIRRSARTNDGPADLGAARWQGHAHQHRRRGPRRHHRPCGRRFGLR